MKNSTKKVITIISFVLVFVLLMFLGIFFYEQVDQNNKEVVNIYETEVARINLMKQLYGEEGKSYYLNETPYKINSTDTKIIKKICTSDKVGTTAKTEVAYNVTNKDGKYVGRAYLINSPSLEKQVIKILVAFKGDPTTDDFAFSGYAVTECESSDYYYNDDVNYKKSFQWFLDNKIAEWKVSDIKSPEYFETYSVISKATYSSEAFTNAFKLARIQIYADSNVKLPEPSEKATFVSCVQINTDYTEGSKVFNEFELTVKLKSNKYNNEEMKFNITVDYDNNNAITILDPDAKLTQKELNAVKSVAKLPDVYIRQCVDGEKTYYASNKHQYTTVEMTVKIDSSNGVSYELIGNGDSRGANPSLSQAVVGGKIQNVSGSTYSCDSINTCLESVLSLEKEIFGGKN